MHTTDRSRTDDDGAPKKADTQSEACDGCGVPTPQDDLEDGYCSVCRGLNGDNAEDGYDEDAFDDDDSEPRGSLLA